MSVWAGTVRPVHEPWDVYISGRISGLDRAVARALFIGASQEVRIVGHNPVNPLEIEPLPACGCLSPVDGEHTWECCMAKDIARLVTCHAILMLPNWDQSPGASWERDIMMRLRKPIFLQVSDLPPIELGAGTHRRAS